MKKLSNPFRRLPGYQCFGCSPDNANGLRMEFFDDGEYIICNWDPRDCFQGYLNVLHGGVISTLLDEIASWVVMTRLQTGGVTSRINVRYIRPVKTDEGSLLIKGIVQARRHNIAIVKTELYTPDGLLAAEGEVHYYLLSEDEAREKLSFPGVDRFYEE